MRRRHLLQTLFATVSMTQQRPGRASASASARAVADLRALSDQAWASGAFPGFQLAVLAERRPLWSTAHGMADVSAAQPATEETSYYIASTTKCFTALAAAQRAARGELDLQASLAQLLPQVAWRPALQAERITLRELLTHTHGIAADSVPAQLRVNFSGVYRDNAELLQWWAQAAPSSEGKAFRYSNMGYDLAAMAMAPAGRDGWKMEVQRDVLDTLGLRRSSPWRSRLDPATLAAPHVDSAQGWRSLPANKQDRNMGPAGGMFCTASDLGRLIQALLDGGRLDGRRLLSAEVLDLMLHRQVTQSRTVWGYERFGHSLGFDMARLHGQEILTRLGSFRGAQSHLSFMPAQGLGIALLSNGDAVAGMAGERLVTAIYQCLLGDPAGARLALGEGLKQVQQAQMQWRAAPPPAPVADWPLPPGALAGRYVDEQLGELELAWTGKALIARWGVLQSECNLRSADQRQWRVDWSGQGVLVEVLSDASDSVIGLRMMGRAWWRAVPATSDASVLAPGRASAGMRG